jgi:hypothetical protein
MKLAQVYKSKLALFCVQFLILTILIGLFQYKFYIEFESNILEERRFTIQFLANYIMYKLDMSLLFLYLIWILATLIPVIILRDVKKVIVMNLITFFLPNFFFYIFLSKYSPVYYENFGLSLLLRTLVLGLVIILLSFLITLILKFMLNLKKEVKIVDVTFIEEKTKSMCPYCGTKFNSIPIYCYKCNKKLIPDLEDNNGAT